MCPFSRGVGEPRRPLAAASQRYREHRPRGRSRQHEDRSKECGATAADPRLLRVPGACQGEGARSLLRAGALRSEADPYGWHGRMEPAQAWRLLGDRRRGFRRRRSGRGSCQLGGRKSPCSSADREQRWKWRLDRLVHRLYRFGSTIPKHISLLSQNALQDSASTFAAMRGRRRSFGPATITRIGRDTAVDRTGGHGQRRRSGHRSLREAGLHGVIDATDGKIKFDIHQEISREHQLGRPTVSSSRPISTGRATRLRRLSGSTRGDVGPSSWESRSWC